VSAFEQLHPALQHHIVNSLGWRTLRPHQEQAISPILRGDHVLVQAPTAGGKTEAAVLPLLSRMLAEGWGQPSILYLCPIKALLNDLEVRLQRLANLLGRRVGVWHGDIGASVRRRIGREPPDILLATPESVEVMLVSRLVDHHRFFASMRAVVVDEVHAFAGDDRGWHLLSLLERVSHLAEHPVQRVALSATLSNAEELVDWLSAGSDAPKQVVAGSSAATADVDVQVDYVGSLLNAAVVISRLHHGEKRLVFCDSRTQVESLASELRAHGVQTFVSHSSLSREERRQAEAAFSQGSNCVIVATSTLELGIDVGDLDRVIQIDSPHTVASFLQRLGRSGRRAGTRRNCLFLTTTEDALLRALGILQLWSEGYVEPVVPPPLPYHVLAQQVLALTLQESGIGTAVLDDWLGRFRRRTGIADIALWDLLEHMLEAGYLFEDGGVLGVGVEGEATYGRKNFLEVFSVFNTPPLFTVFQGRAEIGQVHELTFAQQRERPIHISLGGRPWKVTHIDWTQKRAFVEPGERTGRSRWLGTGQGIHFELCQAIKRVLVADGDPRFRSRRAEAALKEARSELLWLEANATTLIHDTERKIARWWTFAGDRYNAAAAAILVGQGTTATFDSFAVSFPLAGRAEAVEAQLTAVGQAVRDAAGGAVNDEALERIKFRDCVPDARMEEMMRMRLSPAAETESLARQRIRSRVAYAGGIEAGIVHR
jgi:ATP-dependent helicase Lhr and Lhr-like helicase